MAGPFELLGDVDPLLPLLAALQRIDIDKRTVFGLGQPIVQ